MSSNLPSDKNSIKNNTRVKVHILARDDDNTNIAKDTLIEVVIYTTNKALPIYNTLPILESAGLHVVRNYEYKIVTNSNEIYYIHKLKVEFDTRLSKQTSEKVLIQNILHRNFAECIEATLTTKNEVDVLNSLVISSGLNLGAVSLLRCYAGYLWQVIRYATRGSIYHTLAGSPEQSKLLWNIFENRFITYGNNGNRLKVTLEDRLTKEVDLVNKFKDSLQSISSINQDRILRSIQKLISNTLRTNYFTKINNEYLGQNRFKPVAFKLNSANIDFLPSPKPLCEIFVKSMVFEGIHLRSGKTARGGIRWSERPDDYRAEVLGLMKTQLIKNVIVVPTGAKGGFALRHIPDDRDKRIAKVENCYKDYIRSLLSITDNIIDEVVVSPEDVVKYDGDDPYFVVAADKGTATFSDIANEIAINEFNFWLGDAFASGGTFGYDHKKYGITARGAWECTKRHFNTIGINHNTDPFTVVGIGDMSGDVFGNGMIYTDKIKLIAAFNHKHIFIDPNPNTEVSFKERKKLFNLKRSQWSDYNSEIISEGGGVFERFSKSIEINSHIKYALSLPEDIEPFLNGEELITYILKAKVDLLWNGGIGTYIKSSSESNVSVQDSVNDSVRIDANQVRVKVISEGGNLGLTTKGRIEFSANGGLVNSDALDNSAGVDFSDHEVNIKIALNPLVSSQELDLDKRNTILFDVVENVTQRVLNHNRSHATLLSAGLNRSKRGIHHFNALIKTLEESDYLNRLEYNLPTNDDLIERANKSKGLYLPELALCMAGVKMWIKDILLTSKFIDVCDVIEAY